MREMTRAQVCGLIRKNAMAYSSMRAYVQAHGAHISTLSNMLHGRARFTPRVLRLLGLAHVRIVERAEALPTPVVSRRSTYRPMWRLGDWPSGYGVTAK